MLSLLRQLLRVTKKTVTERFSNIKATNGTRILRPNNVVEHSHYSNIRYVVQELVTGYYYF